MLKDYAEGGLDFAQRLINEEKKVFLDTKLFDIGETVSGAVENVARMGASFLTVHGNGQTIKAAIEGRGSYPLKLLSVTLLTSLDENDLFEFGEAETVEEHVVNLARKALKAGCDGVIASGQEARAIRAMAGDGLLIVTPGIRPLGHAADDQMRISSPAEEIRAGADYLVVGRLTSGRPISSSGGHFSRN